MSSAERAPRQIAPPNALYVALVSSGSLIFDNTGSNTPSWAQVSTLVAPGALFRDMGRTLYVPAPTTPSVVGAQSTILKKVQLIPAGAAGYYGTGGSSNTANGTEFFTGYIAVGGQTFGGGTGATAVGFVRAN